MRRQGHTYRIHDYGPITLAFDHSARGGVYSPRVSVIFRRRHGPERRYMTIHRLNIPVPVIGWRRAYALRRLGALRLYAIESRLIYRLFK